MYPEPERCVHPPILHTNPNAKRQTVQTYGKTYCHTEDLIKLTGNLVSNNVNFNCVTAVPVYAMKAYGWRRGTAPLHRNHNMRQAVASFTNDDTLPKSFKRLSTAQYTVHSTVHCPHHSALSTAQYTVHTTEQQPNTRTRPAVLKVQLQSYWDMTSRRNVWVTHSNVRNSLNVSSNPNILHCYKVLISTASSFRNWINNTTSSS